MVDAEVEGEEQDAVEVVWEDDWAERALGDAFVEILSVGLCDFSCWWSGPGRGEMGIEGWHFEDAIAFGAIVSMDAVLYNCVPWLVFA